MHRSYNYFFKFLLLVTSFHIYANDALEVQVINNSPHTLSIKVSDPLRTNSLKIKCIDAQLEYAKLEYQLNTQRVKQVELIEAQIKHNKDYKLPIRKLFKRKQQLLDSNTSAKHRLTMAYDMSICGESFDELNISNINTSRLPFSINTGTGHGYHYTNKRKEIRKNTYRVPSRKVEFAVALYNDEGILLEEKTIDFSPYIIEERSYGNDTYYETSYFKIEANLK